MKQIVIIFYSALSISSFCQNSTEAFPIISGETLDGKKISIPEDTKGKYTLIGLAYSRKAEDDLQTWLNPAYNKFVLKNGLMDFDYDVNIFFIPMFTGINQPSAGIAKKNMREKTDKRFYSYVIVYKGELKKYEETLKLDNNEIPYFFVLDKNGEIIYNTSGKYSDEKMEKLEEKIN